MKTVVITGSARGFGYEMIKLFRGADFNTVLCDINEESLKKAKEDLEKEKGKGKVIAVKADVTSSEDINNLINVVLKEVETIDFWINNAGVNQPDLPIWEVSEQAINRLIEIDLKGTILCSKLIMPIMIKQGHGQIFNVEGYGSNDATSVGLSIYGTTKRAVTYFTEALAHEAKALNTNVLIGKITPGIMITDFITTALGNGEKIDLPEKTKKVYNILGDYPSTIANYIVPRLIKNKKNNAKIVWLTSSRAFFRFMGASFNKRDFFKK